MLSLNQTDARRTQGPVGSWSIAPFRASRSLASLLVRVFAAPCVLIGHCDDFGVGFMTSSRVAGVLKPDYLGFHHNSYYASAYTPHAIHCGALIEFLLSGTPFKLSKYELVTRESKVGTKKKSHCVPTPLQTKHYP